MKTASHLVLLFLVLLTSSRAFSDDSCGTTFAFLAGYLKDSAESVFQRDHSRLYDIPPSEMARLTAIFKAPSSVDFLEMGYGFGRPFERAVDPASGKEVESYEALLEGYGFDPAKRKGQVVVDLGCGFSNTPDVLHTKYGIDAYGVDIIFHPKYGNQEIVRQRVLGQSIDLSRRIGASATNLPIADNSVDAVIAIISLAYLNDSPHAYGQALSEVLRILKPGGEAFLHGDGFVPLPFLDAWKVPYSYKKGGIVIHKPDHLVMSAVPIDVVVKQVTEMYKKHILDGLEAERKRKAEWRAAHPR